MRFLKSPFLHFMLLGAGLFIIYSVVNKGAWQKNDNKIIITEAEMESMIKVWEQQRNRPPSTEEMKGLLDDYVKQEVFYREAIKLKLDYNDEVVRRRMIQKMDFLSNDLVTASKPDDATLKAFYKANAANYQSEWSYTMYQVYFNPDKRENAGDDAMNLLQSLKGKAAVAGRDKGDASVFPFYFSNETAGSFVRQWGNAITDSLSTLPTGKWVGPVPSPYGLHLFFIEKKTAPQLVAFDVIKDKVLADWQVDAQKGFNASIYEGMRKHYEVELETKDTTIRKILASTTINTITKNK